MRREMMRKKWEREAEEALNRPVGPVHYQNVQFDGKYLLTSLLCRFLFYGLWVSFFGKGRGEWGEQEI